MTQKLSLLTCIVIGMFICSCNFSDSTIAKNGKTNPTFYTSNKVESSSNVRGVYIPKYIQKKVAENSNNNIATNTYSPNGITSDFSGTNLPVDIPGIYTSRYIKNRLLENKDSILLTASSQLTINN